MNLSRRGFLRRGVGIGALAAAVSARPHPGPAAFASDGSRPVGVPVGLAAHQRAVIFNADDLGMSPEIDQGILEAHDRGVVTSASLMVREPHTLAAIEEARRRPDLGLGIHVAFDHRRRWFVDIQDLSAVRREVDRQLDTFVRLVGRPPTHIDSHHHIHRLFNVAHVFLQAGQRYGVPVRGFSDVFYMGGFYGQLHLGKTDSSRLTLEALTSLLEALPPGVSEVSCHPGHLEHRPDAFYNREREAELQVLIDPRLKDVCAGSALRRLSFRDYARLAPRPARPLVACPAVPLASGH